MIFLNLYLMVIKNFLTKKIIQKEGEMNPVALLLDFVSIIFILSFRP